MQKKDYFYLHKNTIVVVLDWNLISANAEQNVAL